MGFKFKQFSIDDCECPQKVGTDSIILGSWSEPGKARTILDIGTGCGLLLLMQAQKAHSNTSLIGVELHEHSVIQARQNIERSSWRNIKVICEDIKKFNCESKFDLIISNPPYFEHHKGLTGQHKTARYNARHTQSLTYTELILCAARLICQNGKFRVIIPSDRRDELLNIAKNSGLYPSSLCSIFSRQSGTDVRTLIELQRSNVECVRSTLVIYANGNKYSDEFRKLCKEFYLNF